MLEAYFSLKRRKERKKQIYNEVLRQWSFGGFVPIVLKEMLKKLRKIRNFFIRYVSPEHSKGFQFVRNI